jgi:hypothetical protein
MSHLIKGESAALVRQSQQLCNQYMPETKLTSLRQLR